MVLSEWLCLSILNMSRNPLMLSLDIPRFLPSVDPCTESSKGSGNGTAHRVPTSPMLIHAHVFHRVCVIGRRLDIVEHVAQQDELPLLWRPVETRHVGVRELEYEVARSIVSGLGSSPERVMARSRPFRTSTSPYAGPICSEEVSADRDPLPSSIRSSAHSQDILHLFVSAPKDVANCL